jgi:hypothetical protein
MRWTSLVALLPRKKTESGDPEIAAFSSTAI